MKTKRTGTCSHEHAKSTKFKTIEREGFWKRFRGTRGGRVVDEVRGKK